jgi:hypothetical protein
LALSDVFGVGSMREHFDGNSGGAMLEIGRGNVDIRTLDSFNFKDVAFIKVDIDGHELNVLQGGRKTLESVSYLMVEIWDNPKEKELFEFLDNAGFDCLKVIEGTGNYCFGRS